MYLMKYQTTLGQFFDIRITIKEVWKGFFKDVE